MLEKANKKSGAEGSAVDAGPYSFAIVASRWNEVLVNGLIRGAEETLLESGAHADRLSLLRVPGSYEIPLACAELSATGGVDAIIALGIVIQGETEHHRFIGDSLIQSFSRIMLDTRIPIGFGVVIAPSAEHAAARSLHGHENRGREAALAAIEMAHLLAGMRKVKTIRSKVSY